VINLMPYIATSALVGVNQAVADAVKRSRAPDALPNLARWLLTWGVFAACLGCSVLGVLASFFVLGSTISSTRLWGISVIIAVGMISLTYRQKYSVPASRISFTPMDAISYLIQGFLWPATWPSFADAIGFSTRLTPPSSPGNEQHSLDFFGHLISFFS
jgi:hypothetical protein